MQVLFELERWRAFSPKRGINSNFWLFGICFGCLHCSCIIDLERHLDFPTDLICIYRHWILTPQPDSQCIFRARVIYCQKILLSRMDLRQRLLTVRNIALYSHKVNSTLRKREFTRGNDRNPTVPDCSKFMDEMRMQTSISSLQGYFLYRLTLPSACKMLFLAYSVSH